MRKGKRKRNENVRSKKMFDDLRPNQKISIQELVKIQGALVTIMLTNRKFPNETLES